MKKFYFLFILVTGLFSTSLGQTADLLVYGEGCIDSSYAVGVFSNFTNNEKIIIDWGDNSDKDTVTGTFVDVYHTYTVANPSGYDLSVTVINASQNVVYSNVYPKEAKILDCGNIVDPGNAPWKMSKRQPGLMGVDFNNNNVISSLTSCADDSVTFEFYPAYTSSDTIFVTINKSGSTVSYKLLGNVANATFPIGAPGVYDVSILVKNSSNVEIEKFSNNSVLTVEDCAAGRVDVLSFKAAQFKKACARFPFKIEFAGALNANQHIAIDYGDGHADTIPQSNRIVTHTYETLDTFNIFIQVLNSDFSVDTKDTIYNAFATFDCGGNLGCTASVAPGTTMCALDNSIALNATTKFYQNYKWTTTGNGQLSSATSSSTGYTIGSTDKNISFQLKASGIGCRDTTITVNYVISRPETIAPIADIQVCGSGSTTLTYPGGTMPNGFRWFGSKGFIENPTSASAQYTSSPLSELNGSDRVMIGNPYNICPNSFDTVNIQILRSPKVQLGNDISNFNATFNVGGTITGTHTSGIWTTSGSGTFGNANSINTTYTPSLVDQANGSVTLTLTSTNDKGCQNHQSSFNVLVSPCEASAFNKSKLTNNTLILEAETNNPSLNASGQFMWFVDPVFSGTGTTTEKILGSLFDPNITKRSGQKIKHIFGEVGQKKVYLFYADFSRSCISVDSATFNVTSVVDAPYTVHGQLNYNNQPVTSGFVTVFSFLEAFGNWVGAVNTGVRVGETTTLTANLTAANNGNFVIKNIPYKRFMAVYAGGQRGSAPKVERTSSAWNNQSFFDIDNDYKINADLIAQTLSVKQEDYFSRPQEPDYVSTTKPTASGLDIVSGKITITADTANPKSNRSAFVLPGASVSLLDTANKEIALVLSDLFGGYSIRDISAGVYRLKVSFMGEDYGIADILTEPFVVDGDSNTVDEKDFRLIYREEKNVILSTNNGSDVSSAVERSSMLEIFPNPSQGNFSLLLPNTVGNYSLKVMNASGQVNHTQSGVVSDKAIKVNSEELQPGLYFINLKTSSGYYNGKVTVE